MFLKIIHNVMNYTICYLKKSAQGKITVDPPRVAGIEEGGELVAVIQWVELLDLHELCISVGQISQSSRPTKTFVRA